MAVPKNKAMLSRARELRKDMTPQERKLWYLFLRNYPIKIYKQRIISSFIVDFYCASAKLVIELDGAQHYEEEGAAYDTERTSILEGLGLRVIRFRNTDIDADFTRVCATIDTMIRDNLEDKPS